MILNPIKKSQIKIQLNFCKNLMDIKSFPTTLIHLDIFWLDRILHMLPITGFIGLTTKRGEEIKSNQQQRISSAMCMALLHPAAASCEWGSSRRRMANDLGTPRGVPQWLWSSNAIHEKLPHPKTQPCTHPVASCQCGVWCVVHGVWWAGGFGGHFLSSRAHGSD